MTDSANKRAKLVGGAAEMLYRQGVEATTLAHVAEASGVPVGNIYYYFKTKDDLVRAVIAAQLDQVGEMLTALDGRSTHPAQRLTGLLRRWDDMSDVVARFGCPLGSLVSELGRRDDGLDAEATGPIARILDWAEQQFAALDSPQPRADAVALFAGIQGGAVLANALRDPDVMRAQVRRLERTLSEPRS
ncbi:TetR/AcrR family transcriptional regulator [Cryptosporangium phraense]|uniref:TetR/AcrR family transcriptional regulator n=1 Tax=Cryptosporangium phraense TaxID=2593070 RepID=A0A545B0B2_9ACTN|nr:TetR/AcrR family transcriptional regulator [Cryptosporangium phraense]TQS46275.1 TetR/AcrR family transcriptional regulator [Cryptosporangium phraense]